MSIIKNYVFLVLVLLSFMYNISLGLKVNEVSDIHNSIVNDFNKYNVTSNAYTFNYLLIKIPGIEPILEIISVTTINKTLDNMFNIKNINYDNVIKNIEMDLDEVSTSNNYIFIDNRYVKVLNDTIYFYKIYNTEDTNKDLVMNTKNELLDSISYWKLCIYFRFFVSICSIIILLIFIFKIYTLLKGISKH